jgi:membrane protein implicated in regulation of membrane protease activity
MAYRQIQFSRTGWGSRIAVVLAMALALGLAVAFVILSVGVAIILLPFILVLLAIGWWRWRKIEASLRERAAESNPPAGRVIETDYDVIDDRDDRPGR